MTAAPKQGRSSNGAVAAGHAEVARVGAEVLDRGGNAVDAVVAMIAAGCVCEPTLTSLAGGGFMIVGHADQAADPVVLDFFTRQPGLEARPWLAPWEASVLEFDGVVLHYGSGPASVAVPGIPRGIATASRRFGRLPFGEVLAPSMELAQRGVELTRTQAGEHVVNASLITTDPHGAEIYFNEEGRLRTEGELFCQPHLAAALDEIAHTDGESMYTGNIARDLLRWSDERGGRIGTADLARYEVATRVPLQLCIGDVCMYANPGPSMGGQIAVRLIDAMTRMKNGVPRDVAVGRALAHVMQELDPPRTRVPLQGELVAVSDIIQPIDPDLHGSVRDGMHDRGMRPPAGLSHSPNTTHVSAIDRDGMMCGATTTVGYGAGAFIPDTGIQLNNMLAEYDHTIMRPAGSTVPSMMTPSILISPRTVVQLGSAGSDRIPYAIAQILERMWEGGPLEEAVRAPRFAWDGTQLHTEPGIDEAALAQLGEEYPLVQWRERDAFFGTTNATAMRGGKAYAAGDMRREATGIVL